MTDKDVIEEGILMRQISGLNNLLVDPYLIKAIGGDLSIFVAMLHNTSHRQNSNKKTKKLNEDGWYFLPVDYIKNQIYLDIVTFDSLLKKLVKLKIIELKELGYPPKYWYKIDWEQIISIEVISEMENKTMELYDYE